MKRFVLSAGLCAVALGLVGCAGSPIVGTWAGSGEATDRPFTFGSVSFVGDQTFTAEARYNNQSRVQTGTWKATDNELHLTAGETRRDYTYKVQGDTLTVTEPKSGQSIALNRLKPPGK